MSDPFDKYDNVSNKLSKADVWEDTGKKCNVCNNSVEEGAVVCTHCGCSLSNFNGYQSESSFVSKPNFCTTCGASLEYVEGFCNVCGVPIHKHEPKKKTPAIIAMYITIGAFFFASVVAIIPAIITIILGIKEKNKAAIVVGGAIAFFGLLVTSMIFSAI